MNLQLASTCSIQRFPYCVQDSASIQIQRFSQLGYKSIPSNSALVGKYLLKDLQLELFKEDAILVESLDR